MVGHGISWSPSSSPFRGNFKNIKNKHFSTGKAGAFGMP